MLKDNYNVFYGSMEGTSFLFCFALISWYKENSKYCFI
jgi:hypothetical protein